MESIGCHFRCSTGLHLKCSSTMLGWVDHRAARTTMSLLLDTSSFCMQFHNFGLECKTCVHSPAPVQVHLKCTLWMICWLTQLKSCQPEKEHFTALSKCFKSITYQNVFATIRWNSVWNEKGNLRNHVGKGLNLVVRCIQLKFLSVLIPSQVEHADIRVGVY